MSQGLRKSLHYKHGLPYLSQGKWPSQAAFFFRHGSQAVPGGRRALPMLPKDGGGGAAHAAVVSGKSAEDGREEAAAATVVAKDDRGLLRLLRWAIEERPSRPAIACGL